MSYGGKTPVKELLTFTSGEYEVTGKNYRINLIRIGMDHIKTGSGVWAVTDLLISTGENEVIGKDSRINSIRIRMNHIKANLGPQGVTDLYG